MTSHGRSALSVSDVLAATGKGVRVAIVDSGVDTQHPCFDGREIQRWRVATLPNGNLTMLTSGGEDAWGHGTAVASILAQHAPHAEIGSIRVFGDDQRGQTTNVLHAINWAIEQGFDIVNCSFGTREVAHLGAYKKLVDRAFCKGVLLVAASNNRDFRRQEYPGSFPTVLTTDFGKVEPLQLRRRRGHLVEFVALGDSVRVAWKDASYRQVVGSSFAAPHLAALVARVREVRPGWNACQTKALLYEFAATCEARHTTASGS